MTEIKKISEFTTYTYIDELIIHEKKNAEVTYQMVGANEVDYTAGKISDQSPIGKALLGAQAGETVDVYNIDGVKLTTLKVLEIAAN